MCGIVAIVGDGASRERVTAMSNAVRHRGPDGAGVWTSGGIALGHRRLSIIDLSSAGDQPMASRDGRYQIVFNGELFNYREIAAMLPEVPWRSSSDTEVLLEAFVKWGPACLDHCIGMFAILIWDTVERRLFCARDRLGIKPLYYARHGGDWLVGSEIGALLAAGMPARANEPVIHDFLARDFYEHSDASFFQGIEKLPPGHWAWLSALAPVAPVRYWDLARDAAAIAVEPDRTARGEELLARMEDAVRLGLRSDVRIGIALSGGLDSAVLLALVDRLQPDASRIDAFSFDFADPAYSERPWVEAMSRHSGHHAQFRVVTPEDFRDTVDLTLAQQQEPHAGLPITAYTLCFEQARARGSIVVMDGSGIDEALAGYDRFRPALWADLTDGDLATELAAAGVTREAAEPAMRAAASALGDEGRGQDLTRSVRPDCLGPALREAELAPPGFERPFPDHLRNLMYRELRYTKLPRALRFRDRLSMAYGCELRPPFLDHRLLAYMFALPASDRIHLGRTKSLLRDAAERVLPDAVRLAAKRSVQTPQREWLRGPLAAWVKAAVDDKRFWELGWVDRDRALAAVESFQAGVGDNSFFIWQWLALGRWARAFLGAA